MKLMEAIMPCTLDELNNGFIVISEISADVRKLSKKTNEKIYTLYAASYMWWRDASAEPDYLEGLYKEHKIDKYKIKSNDINWRPFLKLINDGNIDNNNISQYSNALNKIHEEFIDNIDDYENDPINKIVYFIKSNGGMTGLSGYYKKKNEDNINQDDLDSDDDDGELIETQKKAAAAIDLMLENNDIRKAIANEAKHYYDQRQTPTLLNVPPLRFDEGGYALALIKKTDRGYEFVSASHNNSEIKNTRTTSYLKDFSVAPIALRTVLEIAHVMNVPNALARYTERFMEYTKIQTQGDEGKETTKQPYRKKLVYRPASNDFIYSVRNKPASVVVHANPKTKIVDRESGDLQLHIRASLAIDLQLLNTSAFNLFSSSNDKYFERNDQSGITEYRIKLKAKDDLIKYVAENEKQEELARSLVTNLKNINVNFMPALSLFALTGQAEINDSKFVPQWNTTLSQDQIQEIAGMFLEKWITEYGHKTNRETNSIVEIVFDKTSIVINYEYDTDHKFNAKKTIDLFKANNHEPIKFMSRSVDFMFVLAQITDLDIIGDVEIKAMTNAVSLSFGTECSAFNVYIPASTDKAKIISDCFTTYTPIAVDYVDDDNNDYEQEMS